MKKFISLFCAGCLLGLLKGAGLAGDLYYAPPPAPPVMHRPEPQIQAKKGQAKTGSQTEWTFHKSADGSHPDGTEQQLMWLMNRARSNPTGEGLWLATETDPDVAGGRNYFHVDLTALQNEFAALDLKPPAAFDIRLYEAAHTHSLDLIARDAQDHNDQFVQIDNAGFHYTAARGCVFSYGQSGLNAHAAFNIDWGGSDGTGMQTGRGHRMAIMSVDGDYANVGIAAIAESDNNTKVGPLVITGNYCEANTGYSDHFNVFLVGTAWRDDNGNNRYDPGEGMADITVTPDGGTYYAVTGNSGGYALPINDGSYTVTFHGTALPQDETRNITVTGKSVLLDLKVDHAAPIQPTSPGSFPWPLFLPAIERTHGNENHAIDCNGVAGGSAFMDRCNTCVGGTTGKTACTQDCNGVWGGSAVVDRCGVCNGDGSSCSRFTRSTSGHLVTDTDTGLSWQDYQITVKEKAEAITYCNDLTMDGYTDWRFPTFTELQNFFQGVAADSGFDLNHWGSFPGCTASIADGGYVKTPVGAQQYGGNTGDRINFSGHAAVHCVRP